MTTTTSQRTKEHYVELLRKRKAELGQADRRRDDGWASLSWFALGVIAEIARHEGHTEETAVLDALAEVLGW